MTSFSLQNFGCRVNQAEAFEWAEDLQRQGLRLERTGSAGDIVIVNTCTLTERADRDVRRFLHKVGRENPGAKVIVTGCLVDRAADELAGMPSLILLPNRDKPGLAQRVSGLAAPSAGAARSSLRVRALVKVQDGCDEHCTFCVIPSVRGRSVSVPPGRVLDRFEALVGQGFKEIVLTGIHLNSYGLDIGPGIDLRSLIMRLEERTRGAKIRLSSLDPRFLDGGLVKLLSGSSFVCPHFHLSLQHGSDRILARMGRKSTVREYGDLLAALHEAAPDAALGADIIAGFPGEEDEDFDKTFEFVANSALTYGHVFSYSPRPGTAAWGWKPVKAETAKRRVALLRALFQDKNTGFRRRFVGRTLEATVVRTRNGQAELLTGNYLRVLAPAGPQRPGEVVGVTINRVDERTTYGHITE